MKYFEEFPLMGISRGLDIELAERLSETVVSAGLKTIEITMNTPRAAEIILKIKKISNGRIDVGAGTVLSIKDLDSALGAGASFIVMPALVREVIEKCVKLKIPVFPGALTPQEVIDAWNAGATMVKVFPAGFFGPEYMRMLKGPFDKVKLMAVGGVNLENIEKFFSQGADAVAFGENVFKKEWLDKKDFASIGRLVRDYVEAVKKERR